MIKLGDIVSEKLFVNAYQILKDYYGAQSEGVVDVNLRLIKPYFDKLNKKTVKEFHKKFVANELIFSLPEFASSEIVSVPKNMTGVREYRFMSTFSHILYTAFGLVFVECSMPLIETLDFKNKGIYSYFPTRYIHSDKVTGWKVRNKYREEYSNFTKKVESVVMVDDVVLKIDISSYFENIDHSKLTELLFDLSPISALREHNIKDDAREILEFYLDNLMQKKKGVPQGRKNFTSDFFGYFYLVVFDNEIRKICSSDKLEFKASIRYVDDTFLVFKTKSRNIAEINRELLRVEQKISSWLFEVLGLSINSTKTKRAIIDNEDRRQKFILNETKSVSLTTERRVVLNTGMRVGFNEFLNALNKFKFSKSNDFNINILTKTDKESLKFVFSPKLEKNINNSIKKQKLIEILKQMDLELTVDEINIILPIFLHNKDPELEKILYKQLHNRSDDLSDRRILHIILVTLTRISASKEIKKSVRENVHKVSQDSYGKYLPVLLNIDSNTDPDKNRIFERIRTEHSNARFDKKFIDKDTEFNKVIGHLCEDESLISAGLIQALKMYQFEMSHQRWDTSFNQLQNIFHEIMKSKHNLSDGSKIKDVTSNLLFLDPDKELLLRKFYDRRNFNPISHPSKKGLAAEKVGENEFNEFKHSILIILNECFSEWRAAIR